MNAHLRAVTTAPLHEEAPLEEAPPEARGPVSVVDISDEATDLPDDASVEGPALACVVATGPPPLPSQVAAAPEARPALGRTSLVAVLGLVLAANAGVVAALLQQRSEQRRAVAPIAALSVDVNELKTGGADTRQQLEKTQAALEETRRDLAKQETVLKHTVIEVRENTARQQKTEHEVEALDSRSARDVAALASRLRLAEKRAADGSYSVSLGEAVQLVDAVRGKRSPAADGGVDH